MSALFFILLTLVLVVVQTVIMPSYPIFMQSFDLLIINVIFLCLVSTHYSTLFAIVVIGIVMDSLSGAPFCYHLFSYLWIYILVYLVRQFLFQKSIVFIMMISVVSVAIQQGLLLFSIFVSSDLSTVLDFNFSLLIRQLLWGFFIIPPGIWLVDKCLKIWMKNIDMLHQKWIKAKES